MASQLTELSALTTVRAAKGSENYDISGLKTICEEFGRAGSFGLRVVVTPDATPSELQHALAFDLSCFTSLRGCQTLCELMPQAVQDAIPKYRARGLPIPEVLRKDRSIQPALTWSPQIGDQTKSIWRAKDSNQREHQRPGGLPFRLRYQTSASRPPNPMKKTAVRFVLTIAATFFLC